MAYNGHYRMKQIFNHERFKLDKNDKTILLFGLRITNKKTGRNGKRKSILIE